jgi:hypothetical protein
VKKIRRIIMALVECLPEARFLASTRKRDTKVHAELSEIIDNSFGRDRGDAGRVLITWDSSARELWVIDNGRGMQSIADLFRLGAGTAGSSRDIGRYGQGATNALPWLADVVEVWTVRNGMVAHTRQNLYQKIEVLGEWLVVDDQWVKAGLNNVPNSLRHIGANSGTVIKMKVRKDRKIYPAVIIRELSRMYAAGLRSGKRIDFVDYKAKNGVEPQTRLQPWSPGDLSDVEKHEVRVGPDGLKATVKAGIAKGMAKIESAMAVSFHHRQIMTSKEPFRGYDGGDLFGWIDLAPEWHPYLSNNKTAIDDEGLKDELFSSVHEVLKPLLARLAQEAEDKFVAEINLIAGIHLREITKKVNDGGGGGGNFPGPDGPHPDFEEQDDKPKREKKVHVGMPIVVQPSNSVKLGGRYMDVDIQKDKVKILFDKDSDLIQSAREEKPINKLLFTTLINEAFATALVKGDLVTRASLFDEEEWELLTGKVAKIELSSYVAPKLFETIRDMKPEEAASLAGKG